MVLKLLNLLCKVVIALFQLFELIRQLSEFVRPMHRGLVSSLDLKATKQKGE